MSEVGTSIWRCASFVQATRGASMGAIKTKWLLMGMSNSNS